MANDMIHNFVGEILFQKFDLKACNSYCWFSTLCMCWRKTHNLEIFPEYEFGIYEFPKISQRYMCRRQPFPLFSYDLLLLFSVTQPPMVLTFHSHRHQILLYPKVWHIWDIAHLLTQFQNTLVGFSFQIGQKVTYCFSALNECCFSQNGILSWLYSSREVSAFLLKFRFVLNTSLAKLHTVYSQIYTGFQINRVQMKGILL